MSTQIAEQPYRIVIVDDDQFLLDMYTIKFKEAGCSVEGFLDSTKALEHLRQVPNPDALLLDVVMPGLDGLALLKVLRADALCGERTAVMVLSNQGQESDMVEAGRYVIDGYLIKAGTVPSEVLTRVLEAIRKRQTQNT